MALLGRAERRIDYRESSDAFRATDFRFFSAADAISEFFQLLAEHISAFQSNRLVLGRAAMLDLELAMPVDHVRTAPEIKIHCEVEVRIHSVDVREESSLGSPIG